MIFPLQLRKPFILPDETFKDFLELICQECNVPVDAHHTEQFDTLMKLAKAQIMNQNQALSFVHEKIILQLAARILHIYSIEHDIPENIEARFNRLATINNNHRFKVKWFYNFNDEKIMFRVIELNVNMAVQEIMFFHGDKIAKDLSFIDIYNFHPEKKMYFFRQMLIPFFNEVLPVIDEEFITFLDNSVLNFQVDDIFSVAEDGARLAFQKFAEAHFLAAQAKM